MSAIQSGMSRRLEQQVAESFHPFIRQDLLELASAYAEYSVIVTTAQLDFPGPQILYVNSEFTRMTGYSVSELLGKTPRILQGPATDRRTLDRLRATLTRGEEFIARAINYRRDGTPFELEWIISHLRDAEGRTTHYIALQRDLTGMQRAERDIKEFDDELRRATDEFAETLHRLEDAEQTIHERERFSLLGEVTAGVVHDISNALTPVFGLIQLLHSLDQMPPHAQEYLNMLDASAQHATQLLSNLRHLYCSGDSTMRTSVSLQELLQELPGLTSAKWDSVGRSEAEQIQFHLDLKDNGCVSANATEMTQVFVNLVSNAADAMPRGGSLQISLMEQEGFAVVRVADTGSGIPPEIRDRLFEPYTTTKSAGTGLGLCLSKRIVEAHGGTLTVAAGSDGGTVFTVRLPLSGVGTTLIAENPPAPVSRKVLCIDSNPERQQHLTGVLRQLGHSVGTAVSGDDGLRQFFEGDYDVVIAAQEMEPTSGRDVIQIIRRAAPEVATAVTLDQAESQSDNYFPGYLHADASLVLTASNPELDQTLRKLGLLNPL
ncbi:MAG: PAS domain-containing protein [Planctomycetaceae bacterium]|nr:PAS domain-containing protein [Planctomycetaceae bacterium]